MDLKEVTADALKEVLETIKDSKSFVKEQAPALAKEILLEAKVSIAINMFISLAFIIGGLACMFLIDWGGSHGDCTPTRLIGGFVCAGGLIGFFSFMCSIYELISVATAPKLYILKKISEAVNPRGK